MYEDLTKCLSPNIIKLFSSGLINYFYSDQYQDNKEHLAVVKFFRRPVHDEFMHAVLDSKHRCDFISIHFCKPFKEGSS